MNPKRVLLRRIMELTDPIAIVTLLWDANPHSKSFSSMYDESWVEKLFRGCHRNLTQSFEFICFTDRERDFEEPITQMQMMASVPSYADCIEPYKLNRPMILMGLDTIITGNIDHLADYCLTAENIAVPIDPYKPWQVCNGVALVPAGHHLVYDNWAGQNDMDWIAQQGPAHIDALFPGQVLSYKVHIRGAELDDARIVYFHGQQKPHELDDPWIAEHWS